MKDTIIVEGLQGSGKSSLLRRLHQDIDGYRIYYEGDLSPIDLKWCAYMTELEYKRLRRQYEELSDDFERNTMKEGDHYIVAYTRIITDVPGFHKQMAAYEIYDGQCAFDLFKDIIFRRFEAYEGNHQVFEGAFFHHTVDTLLLYYELNLEQVLMFYNELYARIQQKGIQVLYLSTPHVQQSIDRISRERGDIHGQPMWQPLMLRYLMNSPYGKRHELTSHDDLIAYLQRRETLAKEIIDRHEGMISVALLSE